MKATNKWQACELCGGEARLHCASDAAYLCFGCDARVHEANFLVARHARQTLCSWCKSLAGEFVSGELYQQRKRNQPLVCTTCHAATATTSSTSSSGCISSTESSVGRKRTRPTRRMRNVRNKVGACSSSASGSSGDAVGADSNAEGIFVIWCRRMRLSGNSQSGVVALAGQALEVCLERSWLLPFRVSLAAAFWVGLRTCGPDRMVGAVTWQNLRRLEAASGVPGKLIVAVEAKLARAIMLRRRSRQEQSLDEAWAECSA